MKKGKRIIFTDYEYYGNKEGIHIDVFYCYGLTFLLLKSHESEYIWMKHLRSKDFTSQDVEQSILSVLTEYKLYDKEVKFIRADPDPKFNPIINKLEMMGLRWYKAPVGVKTSRAERAIRTVRDTARAIVVNMKFKLPDFNLEKYPTVFAGQNKRYATATAVSFVNDDLILVASFLNKIQDCFF